MPGRHSEGGGEQRPVALRGGRAAEGGELLRPRQAPTRARSSRLGADEAALCRGRDSCTGRAAIAHNRNRGTGCARPPVASGCADVSSQPLLRCTPVASTGPRRALPSGTTRALRAKYGRGGCSGTVKRTASSVLCCVQFQQCRACMRRRCGGVCCRGSAARVRCAERANTRSGAQRSEFPAGDLGADGIERSRGHLVGDVASRGACRERRRRPGERE